MARRHTTKPRKRSVSNVLEARVISPRIAWFGALKYFTTVAKLAVVLALIALAAWGIHEGIQQAFHKNSDFRLQVIRLNSNDALDELELVEITGIDINANLFDLNIDAITARLKEVPALSDVKVERQLPGTLSVEVTARTPRAWIASREVGNLLVDESGHAFPCTIFQFKTAKDLPIILLPESPEHPIVAGKKVPHPELQRCFRLLTAAIAIDPEAGRSIESIQQANDWSLVLVTRDGSTATFGLGDHARQIANFRSAVEHCSKTGEAIDTINLIPKENVPVTIREAAAPPRAVPVPESTPADLRREKRSKDLDKLLNSR